MCPLSCKSRHMLAFLACCGWAECSTRYWARGSVADDDERLTLRCSCLAIQRTSCGERGERELDAKRLQKLRYLTFRQIGVSCHQLPDSPTSTVPSRSYLSFSILSQRNNNALNDQPATPRCEFGKLSLHAEHAVLVSL